MRCLVPVCSRLVVSLLGPVPFPSRRWLYLKTCGPGLDRGLSLLASCISLCIYNHEMNSKKNMDSLDINTFRLCLGLVFIIMTLIFIFLLLWLVRNYLTNSSS